MAIALVATALATRRDAHACATVQASPSPVTVTSEQALIVWNAATHTEHFVRGAQFAGGDEGMGFIVPTPSRPTLAEVHANPFPALEHAAEPRTRIVDDLKVRPGCSAQMFLLSRGAAPSHEVPPAQVAAASAVNVLEELRVGPYDAAILSADDPNALAEWLGAHGFSPRTALRDWLQPYTDRHWILTAFRLAPSGARGNNTLPAVDMAFTTDGPFYPYREPYEPVRTTPLMPRSLFVYVIAESGYEAGRGDAFARWNVDLPLSASMDGEPDGTRVGAGLAAVRGLGFALPSNPWLTIFHDTSSPREADADLFFRPRASHAAIRPPARIEHVTRNVVVPLDCVLVPVAAIGLALEARRRRRKKRAAAHGAVYRAGKIDG